MADEAPLFDPEEDREYTEAEKWQIAYEAVDRYYDEAPGIEGGARFWLLVCVALTVISGVAAYFIFFR